MKISLAHSPDADDAFMFYPLLAGKIDRQGFEIEEVREDIETLNQRASDGVYDVTAISLHTYPFVQEKYHLLPVGACFGDGTGPVLVSHKSLKPRQVLRLRAAIPGKRTTAFLLLKLWERSIAGETKSGLSYTEVPFDQILERVAEKKMDLGLLIHEGQLTYAEKGLFKVVDLGEWWKKETNLPVPLGALVIRRELGPEVKGQIARILEEGIRFSLEHREEALQAALPFARGLDAEKAGTFIGQYVNEMTVDWGRKGLKAIRMLFERGFEAGVLTRTVDLEEAVFPPKAPPPELDQEGSPSEGGSPPPTSSPFGS